MKARQIKTDLVAVVVAVAVAVVVAGPSSLVHASGYAINEQSARATAMAGAFTGVANSPAAIFYNPAGLAQLHGLSMELGLTYMTASTTYTGEAPGTDGTRAEVAAQRGHLFLPNMHLAYNIADRVTLALGIYMPYGHSMRWPDKVNVGGAEVAWWGRGIIRDINLQLLSFNPTAAVRLHPRIYLGLGFSAVRAALRLERAVTTSASQADDVDLTLSGDDVGFGATAGLLFIAIPDLVNVGLAYRSGVNLTFRGGAAFTMGGDSAAVPESLRLTLADGPMEADLRLPHVFSLGLGAFPLTGLTVGINLDITTWSVHDALTLRFPRSTSLNRSDPKAWSNTFAFRLGAEYEILQDNLPLRLGLVFDQAPAPATTLGPELPVGDRYEVTAGLGYRLRGFSVDLAYQLILMGKREAETSASLPGVYKSSAHLVGLSFGYALDL